MDWHKPSRTDLWKAIEIYLKLAYSKDPPSAVRARLDTLRSMPEAGLYEAAVLERDGSSNPTRYRLRLGNQFYPHMKLAIERSPDGRSYLLRADTHDQHCCPKPGTREYQPFCELMGQNQQLAQAIEAAWDKEGLPTFKAYLRQDLARRQAAAEEEPGA